MEACRCYRDSSESEVDSRRPVKLKELRRLSDRARFRRPPPRFPFPRPPFFRTPLKPPGFPPGALIRAPGAPLRAPEAIIRAPGTPVRARAPPFRALGAPIRAPGVPARPPGSPVPPRTPFPGRGPAGPVGAGMRWLPPRLTVAPSPPTRGELRPGTPTAVGFPRGRPPPPVRLPPMMRLSPGAARLISAPAAVRMPLRPPTPGQVCRCDYSEAR